MSLPAFASTDDFNRRARKYLKYCDKVSNIPNIIGMCVFMGICRDTLAEWAKKPGYSDAIKAVKDEIYEKKFQGAIKGEIDRTIYIFDCVNNHGMINTRSEQKSKTELSGKDGQDLALTINFVENNK